MVPGCVAHIRHKGWICTCNTGGGCRRFAGSGEFPRTVITVKCHTAKTLFFVFFQSRSLCCNLQKITSFWGFRSQTPCRNFVLGPYQETPSLDPLTNTLSESWIPEYVFNRVFIVVLRQSEFHFCCCMFYVLWRQITDYMPQTVMQTHSLLWREALLCVRCSN